VDELRGADAEKSALLTALAKARFAHLATHGFFADEAAFPRMGASLAERGLEYFQPGPHPGSAPPRVRPTPGLTGVRNPLLQSAVVLAGANQGSGGLGLGEADGLLTAEEVASADLHGLELIVLSACETARGQEVGREGVFGLQTAFQLAGCRTTVASLWKVDDQATRALMIELYRNLWEKRLGKLEALREAQMTVRRRFDPATGELRSTDRATPLPAYYWGAFTLSGDWR
jgi:CHAT domain-containing protein